MKKETKDAFVSFSPILIGMVIVFGLFGWWSCESLIDAKKNAVIGSPNYEWPPAPVKGPPTERENEYAKYLTSLPDISSVKECGSFDWWYQGIGEPMYQELPNNWEADMKDAWISWCREIPKNEYTLSVYGQVFEVTINNANNVEKKYVCVGDVAQQTREIGELERIFYGLHKVPK